MASIVNLNLAKNSKLISKNLSSDPLYPNINALFETLKNFPSFLRRSRLVPNRVHPSYPDNVQPTAHFSWCTTLPIEFPYQVNDDNDIENWLKEYEPLVKETDTNDYGISLYSSPNRDFKVELISLSKKAQNDFLPHLDLGHHNDLNRQQLTDVLSGKKVLMGDDYAPFSNRYGGHQFGLYAGQLGDGRAITIFETEHDDKKVELQLKGAGRTPYSRFADGLAVLRSSVREYLGSEHMSALRIPTSRALSLIRLPDIEVQRERVESAAIICRLAPSWLRIGSFQVLNPPQTPFSSNAAKEWNGLSQLTQFVSKSLFKFDKIDAKRLTLEVSKLNAEMVAKWQSLGFMHGVLNSDNISLLGLTIDYGPFAFMDIYNNNHICNHTDEGGYYSYRMQPTRVLWDCHQLVESLAEIIGAQEENVDITHDEWANDENKLKDWRQIGLEVKDEVDEVFKSTFENEYLKEFGKRLGILNPTKDDKLELFETMLTIMQDQENDFNSTFRIIAANTDINVISKKILSVRPVTEFLQSTAGDAWKNWLNKLHGRVQDEIEKGLWGNVEDPWKARSEYMLKFNPRFILRQWVLEEAISKLEANDRSTFDLVFDVSFILMLFLILKLELTL